MMSSDLKKQDQVRDRCLYLSNSALQNAKRPGVVERLP